jgi:hypothetical protein
MAAVSALLLSVTAEAHPVVKSATPPDGAVLTSVPTEIRITFSEKLLPTFSGLEVKDQEGRVVARGKAVAGDDKTQLVAPVIQLLKPGLYKVEWHAVSADTHRVKGQYSFTVKG